MQHENIPIGQHTGNVTKQLTYTIISVFILIMIRNAWVGDDIYITMRTVANFVGGHGLTWNPGERVQVYTHPLWFFILSAIYAITSEAYFSIITPSIILAIASVYLLIRKASSWKTAILCATVLLFSKAFIEYSTSGLENALSFLLLVLIAQRITSMFERENHPKDMLTPSLLIALLICNRMDLALLVIPPYTALLISLLANDRRHVFSSLSWCLLGFSPFILWELFSLFYYGFLFPNTAYAKLNTGISATAYLQQGVDYYFTAFSVDPTTMLALILGIGFAFLNRTRAATLFGSGIILYLLYILKIGGDFMTTRLLSVPLVAAAFLISRTKSMSTISTCVCLALFCMLGIQNPYSPCKSRVSKKGFGVLENGIADEQGEYYKRLGMLNYSRSKPMPENHYWYQSGTSVNPDEKVYVFSAAGLFGFSANDSGCYIIDTMALCDPLLARLPVSDTNTWRIGHFERNIPHGYKETYRTGINHIQPAAQATYYSHLKSIVSDPLLNLQRFRHILNMNLGRYNYLLKSDYIPAWKFASQTGTKLPSANEDIKLSTKPDHSGGYLAFGVYKDYPAGEYVATFYFETNSPINQATLEVAADRGKVLIASSSIEKLDNTVTNSRYVLPFTLNKPCEIEPRVHCPSTTQASLLWCEINPAQR